MLNKRPMNLQFFAEGDQTADQQADSQAGDQTDTAADQKAEDKSFSQEDVNNLVAKETKKAQEKLLKQLGISDFESAKDGLQKFKEWQESQKTEAQKQAEHLQELENNFNTTKDENQNLKAQLAALKSGAGADYVADVVTLAKNRVSEEADIETAIKQVIEQYPQFKGQADQKQKQAGFKIGGSGQGTGGSVDPFVAGLGIKK